MEIKHYSPTGTLLQFIKTIWTMEGSGNLYPEEKERILPDGIVELIFHYRNPFYTWDSQGNKIKQYQSFAINMMKHHISIQPDKEAGFVAIRFYPWGAYHFFNMPVKDFIDSSVPAEALWNKFGNELEEKINTVMDNSERIRIIENFLLHQLMKNNKNCDDTDGIIKSVCMPGLNNKNQQNIFTVKNLVQLTGYSERQLERKFSTTVGISPKQFLRINRFLKMCNSIRNYRTKNLAELSYVCGYFDQAHFIKEFRDFSGLTPAEFLKQNNVSFLE